MQNVFVRNYIRNLLWKIMDQCLKAAIHHTRTRRKRSIRDEELEIDCVKFAEEYVVN